MKGHNLDRQVENLSGVFKVFSDTLSGKSTDRPGLKSLLSFIREGDIVPIYSISEMLILTFKVSFLAII